MLLLAGATTLLRASVALAPPFTDGAVLQRDKPIPVWGTAAPGEPVTVTFSTHVRHVVAGKDGRWMVLLPAGPASVAGADLTAQGRANTQVIHDVVVGEVWLCAGGGTLPITVAEEPGARELIANARDPLVREVQIGRQFPDHPAAGAPTSGWLPATSPTVGRFSALAYAFATNVQRRLGVPVGIIVAACGGAPLEAWMSPLALASDPAGDAAQVRWRMQAANFPSVQAAFALRSAAWTRAADAAKAGGPARWIRWRRQNPPPMAPAAPDLSRPTAVFDGMINPLLPYALRGIIWSGGESQAADVADYHTRFATLITAWRAHFGQGNVPFYWINLPALRPGNDPANAAEARLRQAETHTLALPGTAQAVAIDLGDPRSGTVDNEELGRRLALLAKRRVYGVVVDDTGPTFERAVREGAAVRVSFTHVSGGLIARDRPPQTLELAGPDHVFHPAAGRIDLHTLVVTSPQVRIPAAVRYGWREPASANLYNGNGLPAVPFEGPVDPAAAEPITVPSRP